MSDFSSLLLWEAVPKLSFIHDVYDGHGVLEGAVYDRRFEYAAAQRLGVRVQVQVENESEIASSRLGGSRRPVRRGRGVD